MSLVPVVVVKITQLGMMMDMRTVSDVSTMNMEKEIMNRCLMN